MSMTRDEELLARRFIDLSRQAQQRDAVLFGDGEINVFPDAGQAGRILQRHGHSFCKE